LNTEAPQTQNINIKFMSIIYYKLVPPNALANKEQSAAHSYLSTTVTRLQQAHSNSANKP
jgi:hypothetical protein